MRPEEKIEKKFVEECWKLGFKSIKLEVKGDKGVPDQMVFLPGGRTMFFEFKRPDGKGELSKHQEEWLFNLRKLNFIAIEVDSWEFPLSIVKEYVEVFIKEMAKTEAKESSKIIMPGDPNAKH